jgi:small subunit ribosomal protein S16
VAVKIKLKRMGKIREPYYRIVVADARTKRDGRAIEEIGKYHPKADPSLIEVNSDRAQHWLSVGAQPTDPVRKLLEITGDWQRYKGLPGAEGTLKSPTPRGDKNEIFAAALAETLTDGATTPKGRGKAGAGKAADARGEAKSGDSKAERPARASKAEDGKAAPAKAGKPAKAGQAEEAPAQDAQAQTTAESSTAETATAESATAESATAQAEQAAAEATAPSGEASSADAPAPATDDAAAEPGSGD